MTTTETAKEISASQLLEELKYLPIIGFILAFAYEGTFLFFLGIKLSEVVQISDIVRASAMNILPAIPVLLVGLWSGSGLSTQNGELGKSKLKRRLYRAPYFYGIFLGILVVSSFLLFGFFPEIGVIWSVLLFLLLLGRLILLPALFDLERDAALAVWIIFSATALFSAIGAGEAYGIRSGNRDNSPVFVDPKKLYFPDEKAYILKRYASGLMVGTADTEKVWFVSPSESVITEFKVDNRPYQGLYCEIFDWCFASGWTSGPLRREGPIFSRQPSPSSP